MACGDCGGDYNRCACDSSAEPLIKQFNNLYLLDRMVKNLKGKVSTVHEKMTLHETSRIIADQMHIVEREIHQCGYERSDRGEWLKVRNIQRDR